jgi:hypothetical protein
MKIVYKESFKTTYKGYTITYRINGELIEVFGFTKYQENISDEETRA